MLWTSVAWSSTALESSTPCCVVQNGSRAESAGERQAAIHGDVQRERAGLVGRGADAVVEAPHEALDEPQVAFQARVGLDREDRRRPVHAPEGHRGLADVGPHVQEHALAVAEMPEAREVRLVQAPQQEAQPGAAAMRPGVHGGRASEQQLPARHRFSVGPRRLVLGFVFTPGGVRFAPLRQTPV
jgi:hypothetical protein